jgi:tetratricopeptide (TPR) repeat protein
LDAIGILEGTNKSSLLVDYLRHYERIFAELRYDSMNIIEIGVNEGASMRTWYKFFPKATIIGIDLRDCKEHANDRVIIETGNQSDLGFLTGLCEKYKPKIIIDDGSHRARDVLFTFQTMFPSLLPGGFYIIEDLYCHYGDRAKKYTKDAPVLPSEYMFSLGHNLLSNNIDPDDNYGLRKYLFEQTDRIEIIRTAIIICKRKEEDQARTQAWWRDLVEQTNHANNWSMLSMQLLRHNGPLELTAEALRRCIEFDPDNLQHHYNLAGILDRMGNTQDAIAEARRAVELSTEEVSVAAARRRLDALTAKAERS